MYDDGSTHTYIHTVPLTNHFKSTVFVYLARISILKLFTYPSVIMSRHFVVKELGHIYV